MYADVYVRVRSGPYRGTYLKYDSFTTYEVLEGWVPEGGDQGHIDAAEGSVGPEPVLGTGDRPGGTDQGVPDGQAQEEGEVSVVSATTDTGHIPDWSVAHQWDGKGDLIGQDETTPRQLPIL